MEKGLSKRGMHSKKGSRIVYHDTRIANNKCIGNLWWFILTN
ncbi:MAG: hypothetical protein K0S32_3642 [Bacteroidetes bacterium]|jgi:hypothetical protein|nr:hypothetical protein [Bacteroidota bacterium]